MHCGTSFARSSSVMVVFLVVNLALIRGTSNSRGMVLQWMWWLHIILYPYEKSS